MWLESWLCQCVLTDLNLAPKLSSELRRRFSPSKQPLPTDGVLSLLNLSPPSRKVLYPSTVAPGLFNTISQVTDPRMGWNSL